MKAFLDGIAQWFASIGLHPVLGAFIVGVLLAFVFIYRRSSRAEPGLDGPAAPPQSVGIESGIKTTYTAKGTIMVNGRTVEFPPEVIHHIRTGNKIEAIKALRAASGMDLTSAKQAVDAIAASPAMR